MESIKQWLAAVLLGVISSLFDGYGVLLLLVCTAIIFDILTGLVKGKITCNINSRDAYKGFWKKVAIIAGFSFGIFLDVVEWYILGVTEVSLRSDIPVSIPFGHIIGVYVILNESISICENLHECGVRLPPVIRKSLKTSKDKLDSEEKSK